MSYSRRKLLFDPPLSHTAQSLHSSTKKVEWIELLFDLFFVVAIAKLSELALDGVTETMAADTLQVVRCDLSQSPIILDLNRTNNTSQYIGKEAEHGDGGAPFGLSHEWEIACSFLLYSCLVWRVWIRSARVFSSRIGGNDYIGRCLVFLTMTFVGGMSIGLGDGFGSEAHFVDVTLGYAFARFFQFVDRCRVPENRILHSLESISEVIELTLMATATVVYCAGAREIGIVICALSWLSTFGIHGIYHRLRPGSTTAHHLAVISPHHYAERLGLSLICVIGESIAHVINEQSSSLGSADTLTIHGHLFATETRASRIIGGLLCFAIIIPFFWQYFDSNDPAVFEDPIAGHRFQTLSSVMVMLLPCVAAAIGSILHVWTCGDAGFTSHHSNGSGDFVLPHQLAFFFSVPLALATLARSELEHMCAESTGMREGWWDSHGACAMRTFNGAKSLVFLLLPYLSGGGALVAEPRAQILLGSAAFVGIIGIVVDNIVFARMQNDKKNSTVENDGVDGAVEVGSGYESLLLVA